MGLRVDVPREDVEAQVACARTARSCDLQDQDQPSAIPRTDDNAPIRAAEYVRMSTEHQKYSTENQSVVIRKYAVANGIEVVRTYADAGKSGLKIEGRDALKQLIDDVQSGNADFEFVLVYDVSRWGRFQDADEAPTTNISASAPASRLSTAPSNSPMTEVRSRLSSRASNAPWRASTAGSFPPRCSPARAG